MWTITPKAAATVVVSLMLCACGSSQDSAASARAAAAAAKRAHSRGDVLAYALVGAVTSTKPGTPPIPVQVKFALRERPDLSQPVDIDIAIVPTASNLDRISGTVEAEDGLELVGPAELAAADKPVENTPIQRTVKVMAKRDGIYMLTASVSVDISGQISTQIFTIPVIAGQGIPDLPTKAAPGAAAAPRTPPAKPAPPSASR